MLDTARNTESFSEKHLHLGFHEMILFFFGSIFSGRIGQKLMEISLSKDILRDDIF